MSKQLPLMRIKNHFLSKIFFLINVFFFKRLYWSSKVIDPASVEGAQFISIGRETLIAKSTAICASDIIEKNPELTIGNGVMIGKFNHIYATKKIVIHDGVLTANNVYIADNQHDYCDITKHIIEQPIVQKGTVEIGQGAWIGQNACIVGCSIGRNSVVGAGSLVIQDVPDYCVVAGVPAEIIKRYSFENKKWEKVE